MTLSTLTTPWPAASAGSATPWTFGHEVAGTGAHDGRTVLQWLQKRNCSITPRQLLGFYASLCIVSLVISTMFLMQGAPFVLFFAGLELAVVGFALIVFARHVSDRETLTLAGRSLSVEQRCGSRIERTDFTAEWLTVEPAAGQGSLVQLSGEGRTVRVGRYLRPELRPAFARELRHALRRAPAPQPTDLP